MKGMELLMIAFNDYKADDELHVLIVPIKNTNQRVYCGETKIQLQRRRGQVFIENGDLWYDLKTKSYIVTGSLNHAFS